MYHIAITNTIRHHIKSKAAHQRLGFPYFDCYYRSRLFQWGGHIARASMGRLLFAVNAPHELGGPSAANRVPAVGVWQYNNKSSNKILQKNLRSWWLVHHRPGSSAVA
jgi:hypothetical protein